MSLIYKIVPNYAIAIIIFTLVTKLLLFPVNYKTQKNAARMQLFQPKLEKLKKAYGSNPQRLQEEQQKLMQPIHEKVMKAIETEAKAKGLSYVLDQQAMLYIGKDAVDLTPAVKKALGLK